MAPRRFTPLLFALLLALLPLHLIGHVAVEVCVKVALLVAGAYAVARDRRHVAALLVLSSPVVGLQLALVVAPEPWDRIVSLVSGLCFLGYVEALTVHRILSSRRVDGETLWGCVASFVLLGPIFAMIYNLIEALQPGSLSASSPAELQYFSFVTLTSLGYGDIVPQSDLARHTAVLQALTGQLFLTIFIGRLVGVALSREDARAARDRVDERLG